MYGAWLPVTDEMTFWVRRSSDRCCSLLSLVSDLWSHVWLAISKPAASSFFRVGLFAAAQPPRTNVVQRASYFCSSWSISGWKPYPSSSVIATYLCFGLSVPRLRLDGWRVRKRNRRFGDEVRVALCGRCRLDCGPAARREQVGCGSRIRRRGHGCGALCRTLGYEALLWTLGAWDRVFAHANAPALPGDSTVTTTPRHRPGTESCADVPPAVAWTRRCLGILRDEWRLPAQRGGPFLIGTQCATGVPAPHGPHLVASAASLRRQR